nr:transposase [Halomonas korlensis]
MQQAGIPLSRATLTRQVARAAALLSPIHLAQLDHVLKSQVLAMDETPIKAGRKVKGKMKEAWFWPLYGDHDENSFTFSSSRAKAHIDKLQARTNYSEPRVKAFWQWCDQQLYRDDLEPTHPLRQAVGYALKREAENLGLVPGMQMDIGSPP